MLNGLRALGAGLGRYLAATDPRLGLANTVVIAVVGNQPFYPAYVWWIAGAKAGVPAMLTWLSTPAFAAVPSVARRSGRAGKLLLIAAGIGNTLSCTAALGSASGVELFYLPCLALGVLLFTGRERLLIGGAVAAASGLCLPVGRSFAGVVLSAAEAGSLFHLHAFSVGCLLVLLAVRAWMVLRRPG